MDRGLPDDNTVKTALALAGRAPSVHNAQPWRWRIADRGVHVYVDPGREPPSLDPERRDLVISCGAALHHLSTAFSALGWAPVIRRLPDPDDPNHLAALTLVPHRATSRDVSLSAAIARRRTDRRPYTSLPIPPGYLGLFSERAAALGATVRPAMGHDRERLATAAHAAAERHAGDEAYRFEFATTPERHSGRDGVLRPNTPRTRTWEDDPAGSEPAAPAVGLDHAELLVFGTQADDRLSRLRAGEAISSVLLTAANIGLATCLLTEPLEIAEHRGEIRTSVLNGTAYPQAILRVGWPPTSVEPLPVTPRRPVEELLLSFDAG
ncbi:Acg family FMN-binding oxidoreductase [Nocardia xishanensis]|uniref:Acg family FMN-binding oxidoreductase n=1 Tax=Nocardia xishanensis TaxID=238964 RepID=A0ABW7WVK5_9NOCA